MAAAFAPTGRWQDDRYHRTTDAPVEKLDRDKVHVLHKMHMKIVYLQWIGVLALIYVGFVVGDFWTSAYFQWGPPVMTRDVNIDTRWKYWLLIGTIAYDRIAAMAGSYVVGNWRVNVIFNPNRTPLHDRDSYWKTMFILVTDHMVNWLRYSVMVVFIYAQVDFALAFAIPDILIGMFSSFWIVKRLDEKRRESECIQDPPAKIAPASPDKPLPREVTGWRLSPMAVTIWQWVNVAIFVVVFYFTGYFKSPYFTFGAPFPLFGRVFKSQAKYAGFIVFVFGDQLIASVHGAIVGPFVMSFVLNNSSPTAHATPRAARFIYLARKIFGWVRIVFLLSFTLSQFDFLVAMFFADFLVTLWMTHRALMNKDGSTEYGKTNLLATMPLSPLGITIATLVELTIIVIVALAQLKIYTLAYFHWPPPFIIFDTVIATAPLVWIVIVYSVVDRVIFTLTTEITYPYIANVITGCDPSGLPYDVGEMLMIMFMNDVTNWIRRVVGFNFLLSNFSLVLFQGTAEVAMSYIIIERYLGFKEKTIHALEREYVASIAGDTPAAPLEKEVAGGQRGAPLLGSPSLVGSRVLYPSKKRGQSRVEVMDRQAVLLCNLRAAGDSSSAFQ